MKQVIGIIWSLVFCIGAGVDCQAAKSPERDPQFSVKVNLALRQVGHQLLLLGGDEHSRIPPVESNYPNEFSLKLEDCFNYDTLPQLLSQALQSYDIQERYHVVIEDCDKHVPILGYNKEGFSLGVVSCLGRDQLSDCGTVILRFDPPVLRRSGEESATKLQSIPLPFWLLGSLAMIGLGVVWKRKRVEEELQPNQPTIAKIILTIGNFNFDPRNQSLQLGEAEQSLTFRENKLLHFLVRHTNQVVTRETLAAEVWEDEGVIVGRSLDVFISRLRKILKADETVMIKNIHGVGYRLEVKEQ